MAIVSILISKIFGGRQGLEFRKPGYPDTVGFVFDAVTSYSHDDTAEPTENPVEEGAPIVDHVDVKAPELTLKIIHSDTPISFLNQLGGLAAAAAGTIADRKAGPFSGAVASAGAGALFGVLTSAGGSNVKKAYDYLLDTMNRRIPFTVVTGLRRYENMVITGLSVNKDVQTGQALDATVKLKVIRLVKNEKIFVPNTAASTDIGAKRRLGKKESGQTDERKSSLARRILDKFSGGS